MRKKKLLKTDPVPYKVGDKLLFRPWPWMDTPQENDFEPFIVVKDAAPLGPVVVQCVRTGENLPLRSYELEVLPVPTLPKSDSL